MPAPREITLTLPHTVLRGRAWGEATLPPALALHGWLDNAATFDEIAPALAEHHHLVALDLPGHGRSDHAPPGPMAYRFADAILDVLGAADALCWDRFDLIGHSMGGGMASMTAAACPARVRRVVAIEALGALTTSAANTLTQLRRAVTQAQALGARPLRVFATPDDAIAARIAATGLSLRAATTLVLRGLREVEGGWSWASDPRLTLASPQRFTEEQMLDLLGGIEAPVLLLRAPDSTVKPVDDTHFAARIARVPHIEVREIPGGHHLHLENAAPVAAAIRTFLGEP